MTTATQICLAVAYLVIEQYSSVVHGIVSFMTLVPYMEQADLLKHGMDTTMEKVLLSFVTLTHINYRQRKREYAI